MSNHLPKEATLWNQLLHGKPREVRHVASEPPQSEKSGVFANNGSAIVPSQLKTRKNRQTKLRMVNIVLVSSLLVLAVFHLGSVKAQQKIADGSYSGLRKLALHQFGSSNSPSDPGHEIFQVHYPDVVRPYFGESLKQVKIVDHVFGNSYGKPAVVSYTAPDFDFDKVVLTLNTSVSGVQFDRLAHLYLEGVTLWTTSTIEPGGHLTYSSFQKDVSGYSTLFENDGTLAFHLDNIVNDQYTGSFHVELYIDFYKSSDKYEKQDTVESLFSTHGKPSSIIAVNPNHDIVDPSVPIPNSPFTVSLPSVPQNTTRLKLAIFTSGNSDEEFYYTNVLDKYASYYDGALFGHGPLRLIEVSFNSKVIASVNPQPVVFTGGISPALWNPVVSTSAFDLKSYDLDLSPLLPYLWEGSKLGGNNQLQIKNSNGQVGKDAINPVWATTANLLTWEDERVEKASGEVDIVSKPPQVVVIDTGNPSKFNTIFAGHYSASIKGKFDLQLANGTTHALDVVSQVDSSSSNVEQVSNDTNAQSNVANSNTKSKFSVLSGDDAVLQTSVEHDYPFVLTSSQSQTGNSTVFKVEIVGGKSSSMTLNGVKVIDTYSIQNGTSVFYISPSGNHGDGRTTTRFRFTMSPPYEEVDYYRQVDTDHYAVVGDTNTPPAHDNEVASLVQSINGATGTSGVGGGAKF